MIVLNPNIYFAAPTNLWTRDRIISFVGDYTFDHDSSMPDIQVSDLTDADCERFVREHAEYQMYCTEGDLDADQIGTAEYEIAERLYNKIYKRNQQSVIDFLAGG